MREDYEVATLMIAVVAGIIVLQTMYTIVAPIIASVMAWH